jgi:hypothetical protein
MMRTWCPSAVPTPSVADAHVCAHAHQVCKTDMVTALRLQGGWDQATDRKFRSPSGTNRAAVRSGTGQSKQNLGGR